MEQQKNDQQKIGGLSEETRQRIFATADTLYVAAGRAAFPTVDAVRKAASCNMNDASAGMKEWRRAQAAQAAPVEVGVPDSVKVSALAAIANLWHEAQELANESLRAAQAGWEAEKQVSETIHKQTADAYDALTPVLEAARGELAAVQAQLEQAAVRNQDMEARLAGAGRELAAAVAATEKADARAVEIERRAGDLRTELDHAHQELGQAHDDLAAVRKAHLFEVDTLRVDMAAQRARAEEAAAKTSEAFDALRAELADTKATGEEAARKAVAEADALRMELATTRAKADAAQEAMREQRERATTEASRAAEQLSTAQAERDQARQAAAEAREQTAQLRGQMEAVKEQNSHLLQTLKLGGKE